MKRGAWIGILMMVGLTPSAHSADPAPRAVPLVVLLTQAINHATEHRSQIMATLTQLGITPPDLDGWTYFAEHDE